jgi:hypothetical protein
MSCCKSVLTDWNHPGKLHFLTNKALSSQKTCNTKFVVNFLHFLFITHTLNPDKQRKSYDHCNAVHKWKSLEYRFWLGLMTITQNSAEWIRCRILRNVQGESDREFWDLSKKHKCNLIQPTVQELRSLKVGEGASSGQIKLSGQFWTLSLFSKEIWNNSAYKGSREFYNLSNVGKTQNFDLG